MYDPPTPKAYWLFLFFFIPISAFTQERTITGTVTSEDGPLPGVNILIQGTTYGNITNLEGKYALVVPGPEAMLVFSSVGYKTQYIKAGNRNVIDVMMEVDVTQLEEIIVTGYTTQARKNISGAISSVDPQEIQSMPTANVTEQLMGRVPGVNVLHSGNPGGTIHVRIRGYTTINDNAPLYIIDGTPADQAAIEMLNPNDIESIQVLKDAAASSIYGARAANGVIIFTTRSGKSSRQTNLSFYGYTGVQYFDHFPELANPSEVAEILRVARVNAGYTPEDPQFYHEQYYLADEEGNFVRWGLPDYVVPAGYAIDIRGPLDESTYQFGTADFAYARANKEGTNWTEKIYEPGIIQNYNLSATGGSDRGQFALSAGYFDQDGVIEHTNYKRYSFRINTLFNIRDRIRMGENLGFSWHRSAGQTRAMNGFAGGMPEIWPVFDIAGNYTPNNPVAGLERSKDNVYDYFRLLGSFFLEVDILRDLTFKTSFSPNLKATFENKVFFPKEEEVENAGESQLNQFIDNSFNWTWYNTLTYNRTFGENHLLQILAGTEAIEDKTTWHTASRSKYFSDDLAYRHLDTGEEQPQVSGNSSEWSLFSLFGKIDYIFNQKYIFSGTIRRDGSSRFGEENKYGLFPAFSIAWRLGAENFMSSLQFINDLKLRASWGKNGNQNIGNYRITSSYSTNVFTANYSITGDPNRAEAGIESTVFGNPNAKWESTSTTDAGIDIIMFNNNLTLTFDWYIRKTSDLLLEVPAVALLGQAKPPYYNIGEMRNTGIDFALFYNSPQYGDFSWGAGINLTHYKNEVTKLIHPDQIFWGGRTFMNHLGRTVTMEGYPISSFYGLNILGIVQTQEEVAINPWQQGAAPGRWIFEDTNKNDSIDYGNPLADDRTILGSPHPDFTFGIPMHFNYKGLSLNLFWYGSYGNEIYNGLKSYDFLVADGYYPQDQFSKRMLQSWGMIENNSNAILPQINADVGVSAPLEYNVDLSYFIEDASYLRLGQAMLSYDFNTTKWKSIERFRIFFQANNLITYTNFKGMDPEVNRSESSVYEFINDFDLGLYNGQYPTPKTFLMGLKITL